jgi:RNA polymerase sigma factor (sigma-70 family)
MDRRIVTKPEYTGGPGGAFPATRWSVIVCARSSDPAERDVAREALAAAYWKPVYKYIRVRWNKSREDSEDLTQEFFARLAEKDLWASYDSRKARLRTFLRVCVDRMIANEQKATQRIKRGGGAPHLSFDFGDPEGELARTGLPRLHSEASIEEYFEKEWIRGLFGRAVDELRSEHAARGRETAFRVFERCDLQENDSRPSYEDLASEFGVSVSDVTNYLAAARRDFRRISMEKLRECTNSEDEFRREARAVFGVEPQ